jgi:hypothetical protein
MAETEETTVYCEHFLERLKTMPWCRQGENTLVAVQHCTPDIIDVIRGREIKVFPGGMSIKMNKSLLHTFQEKHDEGQPLPVVIVWKGEGVEVWYRRHKSEQFPYDTWTDPSAAAYERDRVFIPASEMGEHYLTVLNDVASRTKECPGMIPAY